MVAKAEEPSTSVQKPLRVIVAGLSCTGTTLQRLIKEILALYLALQELGYTPWHMCEPIEDTKRMYDKWTDALNRKFSNSDHPYHREDFDRLRGKYDALLGIPACLFWDDFHRLYPEARIILTTCPADMWYISFHNTIAPWLQKPSFRIPQCFQPEWLGPKLRVAKTACKVIFDGDYYSIRTKTRFLDYNERVRNEVSPERFLELQLGDGWEPLCAFLDVPVPDKPYPRLGGVGKWNAGASQAGSAISSETARSWIACIVLFVGAVLGILICINGY
ncbi:hypothetical protein N7475_007904 [Penicillium sp. IBT 31633x]|nr:hypothetical protein N7475_007904 [Penicillium sp. IBT 31633x]